MTISKKLNVGCGRDIKPSPPWVNLDLIALPGVEVVADLEQLGQVPLPFGDDEIEEFLLSHIVEHIRNVLPMMEELYRVAQPNALMVVRCPYGSSDDAVEDPTHVRQMLLGSFGYFSQPFFWRADYQYRGDWQPERITLAVPAEFAGESPQHLLRRVRRERNVVLEMIAELRAVKPIRSPLRELQVAPELRFVIQKS